jgi:hypothetical protein
MFFLLGGLFLARVMVSYAMSEGNVIKIYLPITCTDLVVRQQQRLRNSFLRTLLYTDYKGMKQKILLLSNYAKERLDETYQSFKSNYYMTCYHYYSIDENDHFLIENILQLLF